MASGIKVGTKIDNIEAVFEGMVTNEPRKAAELAYVIAITAKVAGNNDKAREYGKKAIELFDQLNVQSQDDCAAIYVVINDIALPDLIHQDVVRNSLSPLEI